MTFEEFYTKYDTGEKEFVEVSIVGVGPARLPLNVHKAPLGELMRDYVYHLKIPWWKRDPLWSMVEERLREKLNLVGEITWHG